MRGIFFWSELEKLWFSVLATYAEIILFLENYKVKDYLVTSDYGQWNNMWIVLAKDAKDAIEQVYQTHVVPMNEDLKEEKR